MKYEIAIGDRRFRVTVATDPWGIVKALAKRAAKAPTSRAEALDGSVSVELEELH